MATHRILAMPRFTNRSFLLALAFIATGCGLFYQAGSRVKASRISNDIKPGESMVDIHNQFGEPSLRTYTNDTTEVWSYADKPNSNDIAAALLYTSTKEGDKGTFLDLKFVDGKLVSWTEAEHTMPPKERSGFGAGINAPGISGVGATSNATSHY
ncbi:MAG TPA: hypothetical protein VMH37_11045 [Candidatus Binataceae bacterium]|nr:hypothetical protein [Candidatus Binataceae bacterium]